MSFLLFSLLKRKFDYETDFKYKLLGLTVDRQVRLFYVGFLHYLLCILNDMK